MMRMRGLVCGLMMWAMVGWGWAQAGSSDRTTSCTLEDGGQVTVRYQAVAAHGDRPPDGRAWGPGEVPMYLFTSTAVKLGGTEIPIGAYSMYLIPEKHQWMLVVNKDVNDKKYDAGHDLAKAPMDLGMVDQPGKEVEVVLGHTGPKQCSLRIYYGKTGAFATFQEQ